MIPGTLVRRINLYHACISILMLLYAGTHNTHGSSHSASSYGASSHPTGASSNTHGLSTGPDVAGAGGLSSNPGYGATTGADGYGPSTGTSGLNSGPGYGTHGSATGHGAGPGAGNYGSSNINAGPHQSNMANKVDPRVDSDRGECMLYFPCH